MRCGLRRRRPGGAQLGRWPRCVAWSVGTEGVSRGWLLAAPRVVRRRPGGDPRGVHLGSVTGEHHGAPIPAVYAGYVRSSAEQPGFGPELLLDDAQPAYIAGLMSLGCAARRRHPTAHGSFLPGLNNPFGSSAPLTARAAATAAGAHCADSWPAFSSADPVLAARRPAELARHREELLRGGVGTRAHLHIARVEQERGVQVAVAGMTPRARLPARGARRSQASARSRRPAARPAPRCPPRASRRARRARRSRRPSRQRQT